MRALTCLAFAAAAALTATDAFGDAATVARGKVQGTTGADVYQHVCQGCHMPGGVGAIGAGAFPALAHNAHLEDASYPVSMVLNGHGGMPWFNGALTDAQVAMVVTYIRTHFGNDYKEPISPAFVASAHGPAPVMER